MVLLDVRSVSMRLCSGAVDFDTVAAAAANVLRAHRLGPAVVVGHSYGTLVATRLQRQHAELVAGLVLLEPVSLLPVWPSLLHNFVYHVPSVRHALRGWRSLVVWARSVFLAKELAVAETFGRKFLWYKLILWPQEVPHGSVVALAGCDDLVPSQLVMESLPTGVQVLYEPDGAHGECLLNFVLADRVAHAVARMLQRLRTKQKKLCL
jgi:pimeloyl-ACP methyl ester carboxylesterase